ncbi:MAG: HAMP domain-containing histidine kinase [Myxococcales bacterium]|nr:HAMP domain-containing histidine kinase [Myxococcales bacterium]
MEARTIHVGLLGLAATAMPAAGFATWSEPVAQDPMWLRFLIAAIAIGLLAVRNRISDRTLGQATSVLIYSIFFDYASLAIANAWSADEVVGILPLAVGCAVLVSSWRGLWVLLAVMTTLLTASWSMVETPGFGLDGILILVVGSAGVVGMMSAARSLAAEERDRLNASLEDRVRERTRALEREMAVRLRAERDAAAASSAKSRFLENMSHELRTPLNAVIGYTEMAREEVDDDVADDLQHVLDAATHLLGIIDDVLDLTRIEADQLTLAIAPTPVRPILDDAVAMVRPFAPAARIRTAVADGEALADPERLRQVVLNLVTNATKFAPDGEIEVSSCVRGRTLAIRVADDGPGMTPEVAARVFDRFAQGDDSRTRTAGGVGLGLAISREIVERMGGAIELQTSPGHGASFTVLLPAA